MILNYFTHVQNICDSPSPLRVISEAEILFLKVLLNLVGTGLYSGSLMNGRGQKFCI